MQVCWSIRLFLSNSGSRISLIITTSFDVSFPAKVATFFCSVIAFVWQFLGKHALLIKEQFEPESNKTLKMRLLLMAPMVLAVSIETGVSWRDGTTFGPVKLKRGVSTSTSKHSSVFIVAFPTDSSEDESVSTVVSVRWEKTKESSSYTI
jgi:hypothetical protein